MQFEMLRDLGVNDDPERLPLDGRYVGYYMVPFFRFFKDGGQRLCRRKMKEKCVKINFDPMPGNPDCFIMMGSGTNKFGKYFLDGTAKPSKDQEGKHVLEVEFSKCYGSLKPQISKKKAKKERKRLLAEEQRKLASKV